MINWVSRWEVLPPEGLTDTGMPRRLQRETVSRLQALGSSYGQRTFNELKARVQSTYQEGEGITAESLQMRERKNEGGFSIEFLAGGRALPFLTALAGLPVASPGHFIPQVGRSRFYWRNPLYGLPPGIYKFTSAKPAFWRPRQGRGDVMTQVLNAGAQQFAQGMIAEHNRILVNFVQNELQVTSKSSRVGSTAGSGIPPQ